MLEVEYARRGEVSIAYQVPRDSGDSEPTSAADATMRRRDKALLGLARMPWLSRPALQISDRFGTGTRRRAARRSLPEQS